MSYVSFIKYIACTERNKKHWTNINGNPWSIIFKNSHRARAGSTWIILCATSVRPESISSCVYVCVPMLLLNQSNPRLPVACPDCLPVPATGGIVQRPLNQIQNERNWEPKNPWTMEQSVPTGLVNLGASQFSSFFVYMTAGGSGSLGPPFPPGGWDGFWSPWFLSDDGLSVKLTSLGDPSKKVRVKQGW